MWLYSYTCGMGGCLARLFGGRSTQSYKKVEDARDDDVESGPNGQGSNMADMADDDDDEEWEDFGDPRLSVASAATAAATAAAAAQPMHPAAEEPEVEEVDPFAGMGMAPTIKPTKRHAAPSPFAKPAPAQSKRLTSMLASLDEDSTAVAGGWVDETDDLDFGVSDRRKANEERRQQRRRERDASASAAPAKGPAVGRSRLGATRGGWE